MGVISETLGNHGASHQVEYSGKVYRLKRIDQSVKSAFEQALFASAKKSLTATRDLLGEEEYRRRLDRSIERFERGEYELFSERGTAYLRTVQGFRLLLTQILDCPENEVLALLMHKKDELVPMVRLILRESFPGLEMSDDQEGTEKEKPPILNLTGADDISPNE